MTPVGTVIVTRRFRRARPRPTGVDPLSRLARAGLTAEHDLALGLSRAILAAKGPVRLQLTSPLRFSLVEPLRSLCLPTLTWAIWSRLCTLAPTAGPSPAVLLVTRGQRLDFSDLRYLATAQGLLGQVVCRGRLDDLAPWLGVAGAIGAGDSHAQGYGQLEVCCD